MLRTALSVLLAASALVAQELQWQLPERGAALYQRKLAVENTHEPKDAWVPDPWWGRAAEAIVLHGELDEKRQRPGLVVQDPREFVSAVALDLARTKAGKVELAVEGWDRFQPVRVEVTWTAIAEDGSQSFEGTVGPDPKANRGGYTPPPQAPRMTGTFRGKRTVDRAKGLVTALEGSCSLVLEHPKHKDWDREHPARRQQLTVRDAWQFERVLAPEDPEFRTRVADGIRKSVEALRRQLDQRMNIRPGGDPFHDAQPGELALILLALMRGGEDPRSEHMQKGYGELRKLVIQGTYSLAVAILAIEALYTPPGEWADLRSGRIKAPLPRTLTPADSALVAEWTKELLDNVDTTVDQAYLRRWHYGPSQSWDNSNTQYALLGLYGAVLCGIEVPAQVWPAAANHWLQVKATDGAPGTVDLVSQAELGKSRTRAGGNAKLQPVGWSYQQGGPPTGSMTTAGITGLTVCASAMRMQKRGNPKLMKDIDAAVRGSFLWFERNLTVRHNPGPRGSWGSWYHYYLYGLERACELNQVALLGGRDWYFEGAMQLLASQNPDGSWGSWVDTAFGLLFLKKTALPAVTGK